MHHMLHAARLILQLNTKGTKVALDISILIFSRAITGTSSQVDEVIAGTKTYCYISSASTK
jgi:hypothetical protein